MLNGYKARARMGKALYGTDAGEIPPEKRPKGEPSKKRED